MAKKNIISDFSTLKGKVSFSGKSCDAKMTPKVKPPAVEQKSKVSEDGLKVGQSVVLMDTFRKVIRENISHRGKKITFIHGIGDGILKAAIRKELDEVLSLRCSYSVGDPAVTVVSIK